jgi:polysaccharide export outer membrane protein
VNYKVTVLGEVNKPSVIPVPNEKITLLEAIGFAGDLTLFAKRDNVLLIREEQGKKTIKRLNLSSSEIFNSPYYYLKSDDVVYVEANKAKVASTSSTRLWLPVLFSGLSLTAIVIDRITR